MAFSYKLIDLGGLDHWAIEARLNQLGDESWELVAVFPPQTAILKQASNARIDATERAPPQPVAAKYRDPDTGETWSGRGRMATWLAERIKSGQRLEDFLATPQVDARP